MRPPRPGPPGRALLPAWVLALLLPACATTAPVPPSAAPRATAPGYRALFRAEAEGPGGKQRFRVAVALQPPDRLRLELLGPVGTPRAVLCMAGARALVFLPAERAYDRGEAGPGKPGSILGLPLDAARLIALLTGRPMCAAEAAGHLVKTRAAAALGRTVAWYEVTCPPGEIRYRARAQDRGGVLREATIREGISGAMILGVEYDGHEEGPGPRWPRRIRLRQHRESTTLTLTALEGPWAGDLPEGMFAPPVPEGFEERPIAFSFSAPGPVGSSAEGGRDDAPEDQGARQDQSKLEARRAAP